MVLVVVVLTINLIVQTMAVVVPLVIMQQVLQVLQIQAVAVAVLEEQHLVNALVVLVVQVTQQLFIGVNYGTTLRIS
jgi:hypothetical protein